MQPAPIRVSLAHHPGRGGDENSYGRHQQAEVPEYSSAGEQGDRGDHQGDLQEDLAEIEAVGFAVGEDEFLLELAGFGLELLLLVFVAVGFGADFSLKLGGGCGVL